MEDDNFGPDFFDDFLDNYVPPQPEDLDDEADAYLATLNALNNQPIVEQPYPNENNPAAANEPNFKRRHEDSERPIGTHPLDWFVNSEFDSENMKRKRVEQSEIKHLSLLDKIIAKKNQLLEAQTNVLTFRQSEVKEPYLHVRPNGASFYQLSSPDCFKTGYIEVYKPESVAEQKVRLRNERQTQFFASNVREEEPDTQLEIPKVERDTEHLWAEKYQPRGFLELLTENEHNKVVLTWLKLWDQHVFKREKTYEFTVSDFYKSMLEVEDLAPFLPKRKMLFLYGPSGCSKSTLAKICALVAGYQPIFIDASEFPNEEKFRESLLEATGNAKISFNAKLRKPVCPIIENIDIASKEIVRYLANEYGKDRQLLKKKKRQHVVRRPIILISNNFFAPALRNLRPSCFAVHISALNKTRTIARLEKICSLENLDIKRHFLVEMFEQCNHDLRMCLNNLQFLCSIWWKEISFSKEHSLRMSEISIFDALNHILTTNPHYDGNKLLPPKNRAQSISNMLSKRSDVDTIYHAIFYNTKSIGRLRAAQRRRICCLLTDDDLINSYMRRSQNWTLLRYTNTAGVLIHFCLANYNAKRLTYNLGFMKYNEKVRECRELIDSFKENLKPQFCLSSEGLQLELLPALYTIIQPYFTLSATQFQFCDPDETRLITRIVEVMSFYNMSYVSSFDNLTLDFRLEPPIDHLVVYKLGAQTTTLNTNAKKFINQLLSRKQIENEASQRIDELVVSQPKNQSENQQKSQGTVELLSDQQRVPGLALLGRRNTDASTARGDLVYITDTKMLYRQGSSQAIRIRVQNKHLFPFS